MSSSSVIVSFLNNSGGAWCDDCLSIKTNIIPRQTVNKLCRSLKGFGSIERNNNSCSGCGKHKIVNRSMISTNQQSINGASFINNSTTISNKNRAAYEEKPWYWEGSVQAIIASYLAKNDHKIISVANTSTRTMGKDIEAITPQGKRIWISVKGWPEKSQNTQARHWFSQALMDIILYRDESSDNELGLGFPDGFSTYLNLAKRIAWFKDKAAFKIYWVSEDGKVRTE